MLKSIFTICLTYTVVLTNGCSSKDLYSTAVEYSRNKAGLIDKSKKFIFGKVSYLENDSTYLPKLVLLHGFGENKDNWNKFVTTLKNKYHVIVPDLAGHGDSASSLKLNYSLKEHAKRLKTFLSSKNIKNFHLIGNSMGGGVALLYSSMYPNDVKTLTLMNAIGVVKTKSKMMRYIEKTKNNPFFDICTNSAYEKLLNYALQKKPKLPDFIKEELMRKKCQNSKRDKYMFPTLLQDINNLSGVAQGITQPTLILWGEKDKILHVDNAKLFQNYIRNSKLVIFKNIGHMPMIEAANKSVRVFNEFVEQSRLQTKRVKGN